ncbi:MAG: hypothetical protein H6Q69_3436 [Firmicutes bacterium]|jgi:hypothetical protein|nr:hypothetical protein [Bacillota bacterium]
MTQTNFTTKGKVMRINKKKLEQLNAFDLAAERGGYVDRTANSSSSYNIRNMHKWCVANNRDIETLTPREKEMFRS